jgi:hypothetical protein
MTKTVAHELIHAYDDCRADIAWTNCVHHACTEVGIPTGVFESACVEFLHAPNADNVWCKRRFVPPT